MTLKEEIDKIIMSGWMISSTTFSGSSSTGPTTTISVKPEISAQIIQAVMKRLDTALDNAAKEFCLEPIEEQL